MRVNEAPRPPASPPCRYVFRGQLGQSRALRLLALLHALEELHRRDVEVQRIAAGTCGGVDDACARLIERWRSEVLTLLADQAA